MPIIIAFSSINFLLGDKFIINKFLFLVNKGKNNYDFSNYNIK